MQKLGAALLGVLHAGASVLIAVWGAVIAEFHCSNVGCPGRDWTESIEAWQWDVLIVLALAAGLIGLATAVVAFSTRRLLYPTLGLSIQVVLVLVVGRALVVADELTSFHLLFWMLLVLASGCALLYARASRQRAGTRLE